MVKARSAALVVATAVLSLSGGVDAFWRMPCRSRTGLARLDPLVNPGGISDHSHAIHGGGDFGPDIKAVDLKKSQCTSCGVTQDKSAYWTPSLHFMFTNGTTVVVPQVGGMLAYYLLYGNNYDGSGKITAFPDGFQMLAGDMRLRNFSDLPVPDPPTYQWTPEQSTQAALRQKAIGFNCLNYQRAPEPTLYRHFMPDKAYLDANCADGLRLELVFPSCWNGRDLDSPDHKSHMAYPAFTMTGPCPLNFQTKTPTLLYETIWNVNAFKGMDGQFVLSYGDPTGYGYHGDFMMGWDSVDFLQRAVDTCTNLSGQIQDCPLFDIQTDFTAAQCTFDVPDKIKEDNVAGPRDGLAINVPIQAGPAYASKFSAVLAGEPTSSPIGSTSIPVPASHPTLTYSPAPSNTMLPGPGLSSYTPADPSPTPAVSAAAVPSVTTTFTTAKAVVIDHTVVTATPTTPSDSAATLPIVGTSYETLASEVLEIVYVQAYVTVTATVTEGPPAPSPPPPGPPAANPPSGRRVRRHLVEVKQHLHHGR